MEGNNVTHTFTITNTALTTDEEGNDLPTPKHIVLERIDAEGNKAIVKKVPAGTSFGYEFNEELAPGETFVIRLEDAGEPTSSEANLSS